MSDTHPKPDHTPPRFEWDYWEEDALEREATSHNWSPMLREVCSDMTLDEVLFKAPGIARRLYEVLLETDGLRVAFAEGDPATSEMIELRDF